MRSRSGAARLEWTLAAVAAAVMLLAASRDVFWSSDFMDESSYEQLAIPEPSVADTLKWVKPSESVDLLFIDDQPSDLQLAASVELEVTHTEPGVRGDTASGGGNKPATLETGATINVPLFVNIGDTVKVDTRSGSYMSRA